MTLSNARGRAVFLFWAGHLPSRPIDLERVLMLIMRTLDPYAHNEYILIYVHTTLAPENEPSFAWLRKVYDLFDRRLKDNLHLLHWSKQNSDATLYRSPFDTGALSTTLLDI